MAQPIRQHGNPPGRAVDRGIEFQQNVLASGIGVLVVLTPANRLKALRALVPQILDGLTNVTVGQLIRVGG